MFRSSVIANIRQGTGEGNTGKATTGFSLSSLPAPLAKQCLPRLEVQSFLQLIGRCLAHSRCFINIC